MRDQDADLLIGLAMGKDVELIRDQVVEETFVERGREHRRIWSPTSIPLHNIEAAQHFKLLIDFKDGIVYTPWGENYTMANIGDRVDIAIIYCILCILKPVSCTPFVAKTTQWLI